MPAPASSTGFQELNSPIALNGTTEVTIVSAPASNKSRVVTAVNFYNGDTAAVSILLQLADGATRYPLLKRTIGVGQSRAYDVPIILDSTTRSLVAKMSAAAATTNPTATPTFAEIS